MEAEEGTAPPPAEGALLILGWPPSSLDEAGGSGAVEGESSRRLHVKYSALNFQISRGFFPLPRRACSKQFVSVWRSVGRASERAHPLIRMKVPPLSSSASGKVGNGGGGGGGSTLLVAALPSPLFVAFLWVRVGRKVCLMRQAGERERRGAVGYIHSIPSPPHPHPDVGAELTVREGGEGALLFLGPLPVSPAHYF